MSATLAVPEPQLMTAEEYLARYAHTWTELVNGIVQELPVPEQFHGFLCAIIGNALFNWSVENSAGYVTSNDSAVKTRTDPDTVRGADWCYFSHDRIPPGGFPRGRLDVVPDLVVEVRSPTDRWTRVMAKAIEYLDAGVRAVVLVNPQNETVVVYRENDAEQPFQRGDTLTIPDILPGFTFPVARLFG